MNKNQNTDKIRIATQKILSCDDAIGEMHEAVHEMYEVYTSISGVSMQNQNTESIYLDSGKAISTEEAAHCLLEMVRTTKFLRGIKEAFDAKIAANVTDATLVTPLLLLYRSSQIQVDLLDINEEAIQSAIRVINDLGCGQFIRTAFIEDAAKIRLNTAYDVVISETMQAALKKEPQVAIMQNLIPQCAVDTIFIPQEITVNAEIISKGKWNDTSYLFEDIRRTELGEVLKVNKEKLNCDAFKTVFPIPNNSSGFKTFIFTTTIRVYGTHQLKDSDCSLTIPLKIHNLTDKVSESVRFWYGQGKVPGIRFQFSDSGEIHSATGRKDYQTDLYLTGF
jgi:predicted RNA methylase